MLPLSQAVLCNRLLAPIPCNLPEEQAHGKDGIENPYTDKQDGKPCFKN